MGKTLCPPWVTPKFFSSLLVRAQRVASVDFYQHGMGSLVETFMSACYVPLYNTDNTGFNVSIFSRQQTARFRRTWDRMRGICFIFTLCFTSGEWGVYIIIFIYIWRGGIM